jgi:ATP-binding cassette subfamily B protein
MALFICAGARPFDGDAMTTTGSDEHRDPRRLAEALRLVLRRYAVQIRRRPAIALPALFLPGIGDVLIFYAPRLVVAKLLSAFARDEQLSARDLTPYVLTFAGLWLAGEVVWRITVLLIARTEIRGMEALYIEAMDELLAKDLSFFQNNYAGSRRRRHRVTNRVGGAEHLPSPTVPEPAP